jgi:hypothetical protein
MPLFKDVRVKGLPEASPLPFFNFEFEKFDLGKEVLQELILDEVLLYRNSHARKMFMRIVEKYPEGILELIYEHK